MENFKQKTFLGVIWIGVGRFGTQISQFVVSIILARLLEPKDFGLVAIVAVFTALGGALSDGGFGAALVQKRNINRLEESSVFYINIMIGLIMSIVLFLSSSFIADFYNDYNLENIIRALSTIIFIESFGSVPRNLMSKKLEYKIPAKIEIFTSAIAGGVGVTLAFVGCGVWALIVQQIVGSVVRIILLYVLYTWKPLRRFSFKVVMPLFTFGSKFLLNGIFHTVFDNMYRIVVGKIYTMSELGYFQRARSLNGLIKGNTGGVVEHIIYPYLSAVNDDLSKFRSSFTQGIRYSSLILFPIMVGAIVVAEDLIVVLVSEKWLTSVPMFQVLGVITLVNTFSGFNIKAIAALGKASLYLYIEVLSKLLMAISIIVAYRYGVVVMLISNLILSTLPTFIITIIVVKRLFDYGILDLINGIYKILLASLIMAIVVFGFSYCIHSNPFLLLIVQVLLGSAIYGLSICLLERGLFFSVLGLVKNNISRR